MSYLDVHCHLQDPRVEAFLGDWLKRAKEQSITQFMLGGVCPEDWARQEQLQKRFPDTFFRSAGLHPWWVSTQVNGEAIDAALSELRKTLGTPGWLALGEAGLDYHDRFSENARSLQRYAFKAQVELSHEFRIPMVLHVVRAHSEALAILHSAEVTGDMPGGMVHSFSGSLSVAREYLRMGFLLSLSAPVLTRNKGKAFHQIREVVLETKLSDLLIETDSPDQPPADQKGELNTLENLWKVAEVVSRWKSCRPEDVLETSKENWKRKFLSVRE
jgi:TatD DNase family protein